MKLAAILTLVVLMFSGTPAVKTSAELIIETDFDADDNVILTSQIIGSVNEVAWEYPEVRGVRVTTELIDPSYAVAGNRTIKFNDNMISDLMTYQYMINEDVAHGFHPPLGRCSAVQYLAYHEAAHIIHRDRDDDVISAMVRQRFGDGTWLKGVLPRYSFYSNEIINPPEALAEAFAAVRCNGGNWAELELHRILTGR